MTISLVSLFLIENDYLSELKDHFEFKDKATEITRLAFLLKLNNEVNIF